MSTYVIRYEHKGRVRRSEHITKGVWDRLKPLLDKSGMKVLQITWFPTPNAPCTIYPFSVVRGDIRNEHN